MGERNTQGIGDRMKATEAWGPIGRGVPKEDKEEKSSQKEDRTPHL